MTFDREQLQGDRSRWLAEQSGDIELSAKALDLLRHSYRYNYAYQWNWLGLPIIQLPQDVMAVQEIIWDTKPDIVIETGIAWGGSVVLYASLLQLIGKGKVLAIDLNLLEHVSNRIMSYPFSSRIHLFKGSSTDPEIVAGIKEQISPNATVMVILDSNHSHEHVLGELRAYAPLVTPGCYLIVADTIVEDIPSHPDRPRPWGHGNNPKSALAVYLKENPVFELDHGANSKLLLSFNPEGYLRRMHDE